MKQTDTPSRTLWPPPRGRGLTTLAAAYAIAGGSVAGWLLFNIVRSFWGLVIGLAVMVALGVATGLRGAAPRVFGLMMIYSLAFAALTWPVLLLLAGGLWGSWE